MQRYVRGTRLIAQRAELIEHELHADTDEFDQLGVSALVRLVSLLGVDRNMRDFGQVAHDFADVAGKT